MKLHLKTRYYKHSKVGREPIRFHVRQPGGIGSDVRGTIWLDPVLRQESNADLRKALLRHETDEIKVWGSGKTGAHTKAKSREPKLIRSIGGVTGFWREIKKREHQASGERAFPTWAAAHEFARQKRKEGYEVQGCGGRGTNKSQKYIVTFRKGSGKPKPTSPRLHAYKTESPDHIVARMKKERRKPLRSVKTIIELVESALRHAGITGIKVMVDKIPVGGPHMDAAVRYMQVHGRNKPDQLIIHPMHQYTSDDTLSGKIKHEIDHLVELKRTNKPHIEISPTKLGKARVPGAQTPATKVIRGVGYADKGNRRLSRRHHRGWKKVRFA